MKSPWEVGTLKNRRRAWLAAIVRQECSEIREGTEIWRAGLGGFLPYALAAGYLRECVRRVRTGELGSMRWRVTALGKAAAVWGEARLLVRVAYGVRPAQGPVRG